MKRHPSLEPFSRDHNDGLILSRRLIRDGVDALPEFAHAWSDEMQDHFAEEERLLGPLMSQEELERMVREHREIERLGLGDSTQAEVVALGELLEAHIRWEERELFVAIEKRASEAELRSLAVETNRIEDRRNDVKRAELVARRPNAPHQPILANLPWLSSVSDSRGAIWSLESSDLHANLVRWPEGEGVPEHINDEVDVLFFVVDGCVRLRVEERLVELRQGELALIPKGERREIRAIEGPASYFTAHVRRAKLWPKASRRDSPKNEKAL